MATDLTSYANRNLSQPEWQDLTKQGYGQYDFNKLPGSGTKLGSSEYEVYHTGTGWGIRQPGNLANDMRTGPPSTASGPPPPITSQQQVGNTTAPVGGSIQPGQPATIAQSYQQALVNRLNPQPISSASPEVAPAIQANQLAEQRGMERQRAQIAERAGSQGLDQNAFNSQLFGAQQASAGRQSQFAGNAVMQGNLERGVNDRAAMASAAGLLGGNANLSAQQQLAELDAQLRREGLGVQRDLGQADIGLRGRLGEAGINASLLGLLLNNDTANRGLSLQSAGLDQSGLLGLLGLL